MTKTLMGYWLTILHKAGKQVRKTQKEQCVKAKVSKQMQNIFMGWVVVYIRLWVAVYIRIYLYGRWWCIMCGSWCISTDLHLVYLEVVVYIYTKYLYLDGGWMCISTHSISILGWWCISTLSVSRRWVVEYIYTEYLYRRWGVWRHRPGPRHLPVDTPVCTRRHGHTTHIYTYLRVFTSTHIYASAHTYLRIFVHI